MYDLLIRQVGIPPQVLNKMRIERGHRKGPYIQGMNRAILVKFHFFPDKQYVLSCASRLKGSKYFINEDYAAETEIKRRTLYPIVKAARQLPQYKDKVWLHIDKLRVDGRTYTVENMLDLPAPLNLTILATKVDECFVRFFGKASHLSNFHPSKIKINGHYTAVMSNSIRKAKLMNLRMKRPLPR